MIDKIEDAWDGWSTIAEYISTELRKRGWDLPQAVQGTDLDSDTLFSMMLGKPVSLELVGRFARATNNDPILWRAVAAGINPEYVIPAELRGLSQEARGKVPSGNSNVPVSDDVLVPIIGIITAAKGDFINETIEGACYIVRGVLEKTGITSFFAVLFEARNLESRDGKSDSIMFLAENTTRVLKEQNWSYRRAQIQTGVNYSVIQKMAKGLTVDPENAAKFGVAVGEDPDKWRVMAIGIDPRRLLPPGF